MQKILHSIFALLLLTGACSAYGQSQFEYLYSDGSYLVYGTYDHVNFAAGIFLLKIAARGTLIWSRTINSQLTGAFMKVRTKEGIWAGKVVLR